MRFTAGTVSSGILGWVFIGSETKNKSEPNDSACKTGFDTAESEPPKVWISIQWDMDPPPLGFDQLHEYHSGYRAIKPIRSAKENHPLLFIMPDDPPSDVTGSKMPVFQQSADQVHGSMLFQFLHWCSKFSSFSYLCLQFFLVAQYSLFFSNRCAVFRASAHVSRSSRFQRPRSAKYRIQILSDCSSEICNVMCPHVFH